MCTKYFYSDDTDGKENIASKRVNQGSIDILFFKAHICKKSKYCCEIPIYFCEEKKKLSMKFLI